MKTHLASIAIALLVVTGAVVPAVSAAADEPKPITSTEAAVTFVERVLEMKGHLNASVQNAMEGNTKQARLHAGHPREKYWSLIAPAVREANATFAEQLRTKLASVPDKLETMNASAYRAYVTGEIYPMLDRAVEITVAAEARDGPAFEGTVAMTLLDRIAVEYDNAMSEGKILNYEEYWDARGFAAVLESRYASEIAPALSAENAEEIAKFIDTLQRSIAQRKAVSEVKPLIEQTSHEIAEYTGVEESDPSEAAEVSSTNATIRQIKENLDRVLTLYKRNKSAEALQLLSQTYMTKFEGLEGPLIEERPELVERLEAAFNEKLPSQIENGAPVSEVKATIERMKEDLTLAKRLLADQGETTIRLENETTTTTEQPTTEPATTTTSPGFGAAIALVALLGAGLLAVRRSA